MNDPVKVLELRQAVCDACGWHTAPVIADETGVAATREWARLHRVTCPIKLPFRKADEALADLG
jgi:hypothetical protein